PTQPAATATGSCGSSGSRQAAAAARAQWRLARVSGAASGRGNGPSLAWQQRQRAQAGVPVRGAMGGTEFGLAGQAQAVAPRLAFGLGHPARQPADASLMAQCL